MRRAAELIGDCEHLCTKACARCAAPFLCQSAPGCWCEGVTLTAEAARKLCNDYEDCLCPGCLEPANRGHAGR